MPITFPESSRINRAPSFDGIEVYESYLDWTYSSIVLPIESATSIPYRS